MRLPSVNPKVAIAAPNAHRLAIEYGPACQRVRRIIIPANPLYLGLRG